MIPVYRSSMRALATGLTLSAEGPWTRWSAAKVVASRLIALGTAGFLAALLLLPE